jgi:tetratricopeptide (TPR) repeat protein
MNGEMRTSWTVLFLILAVSIAGAAPQVIMESGRTITGTAIRADEKGTIFLRTPEGELTFPAGTTVVVDEPAEYRAALNLLQQKQYAEAVKGFRIVMERFRFLVWDKKGEPLMAGALLGMKDYSNAVAAYEQAFAHSPQLREDPEVWSNYLESLLGAGQNDKLNPILEDTIRKSPRAVAAKAQMMRGRSNWQAGNTEAALLDFLRTAELFGDVPEFQAEAYFRAGECFEKLGDPRAKEFFGKVKKDFANSPFASEANKKNS